MPRSPDSYHHELESIGPPLDGPERAAPKPDTRPLPERAEELYALWSEYRRRKLVVLQAFRTSGQTRSLATTETALAADPDLTRLGAAIAARWHDPALQTAFTAQLTRELEARPPAASRDFTPSR